jgi:hypothetical protein
VRGPGALATSDSRIGDYAIGTKALRVTRFDRESAAEVGVRETRMEDNARIANARVAKSRSHH